MWCGQQLFISFRWLNNYAHMKTWRVVRCGNNSPIIGFIWRWSLSPLVPFVYSDVDSIFHCLLLSPWKWTITFCKLISATHWVAHQTHAHKTTQSSTPFSLTYSHTVLYLLLCERIHLGHEEIQNVWFFSCLLGSNPPNPLFAMLRIYWLCLNFSRIEWYWRRKGLEALAAIVIRW